MGDTWLTYSWVQQPSADLTDPVHRDKTTPCSHIYTPKADTNFVATALTWEFLSTC